MSNNFKFDNILTKMVKVDLANGLVPMLLGEPGIGKSSWVEALAESMHTKSFTLACNQLADKSDLTGARSMKTEKIVNGEKVPQYVQAFYPHIVISDAMDYAEAHPDETPILFLDELNRTTSDVTSEVLSIPTLRSIGDRKLPDNLKVITAGNDRGNVNTLDTASVSRFVLYHVEPDVATFLDLDDTLNKDVRAVLTKNPSYIFMEPKIDDAVEVDEDDDDDDNALKRLEESMDMDERLSQITTPRTITSLSRWLNSYSDDELRELMSTVYSGNDGESQSALLNAIEAHSGETAFSTDVCDQITNRLSTPTSSTTNTVTVRKPKEFNDLVNAASIKDLDQQLSSLTTTQLEHNFIYALYNKDMDSNLLNEIIKVLPDELSDKANVKLFTLASGGQLNVDNVRYFCNLNAPIVDRLATLKSFC